LSLRLSDATPSPRDGTALVLPLKPIIGGVWPVTEWHEAFEKMHKGEVVKSVLRPV
jgi:Zn-dependent alcohol dehydrogenase